MMFSTWVRCSSGSRIVAASTAGSLRFSGLVTAAGLTPATSRMVRRQSPLLRFSAAPSPKLRSIVPTPPSPFRLSLCPYVRFRVHQRTCPYCRCCSRQVGQFRQLRQTKGNRTWRDCPILRDWPGGSGRVARHRTRTLAHIRLSHKWSDIVGEISGQAARAAV